MLLDSSLLKARSTGVHCPHSIVIPKHIRANVIVIAVASIRIIANEFWGGWLFFRFTRRHYEKAGGDVGEQSTENLPKYKIF